VHNPVSRMYSASSSAPNTQPHLAHGQIYTCSLMASHSSRQFCSSSFKALIHAAAPSSPRPTMLSEQPQSPFFSKLPLELRREIYHYTLPAGQTIYVEHKTVPPLRTQFRASRKYEFDHAVAHDAVWHDTGSRSYSHRWCSYRSRKSGTLGVYMACWKMYVSWITCT
jgi:hypothetical protein